MLFSLAPNGVLLGFSLIIKYVISEKEKLKGARTKQGY